MGKLTTAIAVVVLAAVLVTAGVLIGLWVGREGGVVRIEGSGNPATQEMDFSDFTRIEAGPAFEFEIVRSDSYSVSITTDDNLVEYIDVSKEGETLKVGLKPGTLNFTTLKAEITMPELYGLNLSAATRGTVQGFSSSHDFILELSGASTLTGDITAGDAQFEISGASIVSLQGSARDIVIEASGASNVELASFPVNNADVKLSGASSGTVKLDGTLDADLSGFSHLGYFGNPTMGTVNISGGSSLSKKG